MRLKSFKPQPKNEFSELLKTENKDVQVERIKELLGAATVPVYVLSIVMDPRVGKPFVYALKSTGDPMDYETGHKLLDAARAELVKSESEQRARASVAPDQEEETPEPTSAEQPVDRAS